MTFLGFLLEQRGSIVLDCRRVRVCRRMLKPNPGVWERNVHQRRGSMGSSRVSVALWDEHTGGTTGIVDAWQSLIPRVDLWSLRRNLGENPELEIRSRQVDKNFKLLPNSYSIFRTPYICSRRCCRNSCMQSLVRTELLQDADVPFALNAPRRLVAGPL